jgi:excisionase family DNA binding protein
VGAPELSTARSADAEIWTAADVARYLRVSRSWVYREASAGRLPHVRVLGLLRFEPATIRALRDAQQPATLMLPGERP